VRRTLLLTACSCLLTTSTPVLAAGPTTPTIGSPSTSAAALLSQLSTAFSAGKAVHQVQLSGTAAWHAGSFNDEGAATLSGTATGSSQLQLSLSSGSRSEAQSGQGTNLACTWAGADAVAHNVDPGNCWRPVLWFLPPLSLQPSQLASYLGALDLGTGAVGFGAESYRHLQAELVLPNLSDSLTSIIMQRSTATSGLTLHRCCRPCWLTPSTRTTVLPSTLPSRYITQTTRPSTACRYPSPSSATSTAPSSWKSTSLRPK